jgi:hypothetical protein
VRSKNFVVWDAGFFGTEAYYPALDILAGALTVKVQTQANPGLTISQYWAEQCNLVSATVQCTDYFAVWSFCSRRFRAGFRYQLIRHGLLDWFSPNPPVYRHRQEFPHTAFVISCGTSVWVRISWSLFSISALLFQFVNGTFWLTIRFRLPCERWVLLKSGIGLMLPSLCRGVPLGIIRIVFPFSNPFKIRSLEEKSKEYILRLLLD